MKNQRAVCVYTALIGGYESLNEQPVATTSGIPFICLTDNPALRSETWQVVHVPTAFAMDPIRSQRLLKICAHRVDALAAFDASLYIDNSVILQAPPEEILQKMPWGSGLGLVRHSFRQTLHDEFLEVARLGLDDQNRIFEQLNHYLIAHEEALSDAPLWGAILLRDHRLPRVRDAMELWAAHVMRYSRRDQLSLGLALRQAGLDADVWGLDNHRSWFHAWPHAPDRNHFAGTRLPMKSLMPVASQLHELHNQRAQQHDALSALQQANDAARLGAAALEQQMSELHAQLQAAHQRQEAFLAEQHQDRLELARLVTQSGQLNASNAQLLAELQRLHTDKQQLQQDLASTVETFRASTSWRVSAPLRKIKSWLA